MDRSDLQQLSKEQLIELVLRLQRPDKNSRTSSKPPSTDKKEKRENARPGGAKLGHEPHNRRLADNPDAYRDHMPTVLRGLRRRAFERRSARTDRRIRRDRDTAGQALCRAPSSLRVPMRVLRLASESAGAGGGDGDAPHGEPVEPSGRAFMRWRSTTRVSRRSPTSGCAACSATRSGST
jgi:hypothetical protein